MTAGSHSNSRRLFATTYPLLSMRITIRPLFSRASVLRSFLILSVAAFLPARGAVPGFSVHHTDLGDIEVVWLTTTGESYILTVSDDNSEESWLAASDPILGDGGVEARNVLSDQDPLFLRLSYTSEDIFGSEDFDLDGLPTAWEISNHYDPINPVSELQDIDGDGLTTLVEYRGGTQHDVADANARSFVYDGKGQLIRVVYPNGEYISYTYDGAGNLTSARVESN